MIPIEVTALLGFVCLLAGMFLGVGLAMVVDPE